MKDSEVFDAIIDELFAKLLPSTKSEWFGKFVEMNSIKNENIIDLRPLIETSKKPINFTIENSKFDMDVWKEKIK